MLSFSRKKIVTFVLVALIASVVVLAAAPVVSAQPATNDSGNSSLDLGDALGNVTDFGSGISINYGSCGADPICHVRVALQWLVMELALMVLRLGAVILMVGAYGTHAMIAYGMDIINLPIIGAGFKVSLSLTNLFFVLAIILMAFGTMLRNKSYNIKSQLRRLIFAAVLVNFSFLIAGLFIDLGNVLTASFLEGTHPDKIGRSLSPQSLLAINDARDFGIVSEKTRNSSGKVTSVTSGIDAQSSGFRHADGEYLFSINADQRGIQVWFKLLLAISISTLITYLMSFVMIALMIMILVRNVYIAVLLIFMPLVWGIGLMPKLNSYSKKWWDEFVKWIIYLPTVTFFVFLALSTMAVTARNGGLLGGDFLENTLQILVLLGLLWAAIKVGKGAGLMGAGLAFAAGGFIAGKALRLSRAGAGGTLRATGSGIGYAGRKMEKVGYGNMKKAGAQKNILGAGAATLLGVAGSLTRGAGAATTKTGVATADPDGKLVEALKNPTQTIDKAVGATQRVAAGKAPLPFTRAAKQQAAQKIASEKYKGKSKEELLAEIEKGGHSNKETAAILIALSREKGLSEIQSPKTALTAFAKSQGHLEQKLTDSIRTSLGEKNVLLGGALLSLDKTYQAQQGQKEKAKAKAKKDKQRQAVQLIESIANAHKKDKSDIQDVIKRVVGKAKADGFAGIDLTEVKGPVRNEIIKAGITAGVASSAKSPTDRKRWRGYVEDYISSVQGPIFRTSAMALSEMDQVELSKKLKSVESEARQKIRASTGEARESAEKELSRFLDVKNAVNALNTLYQSPGSAAPKK